MRILLRLFLSLCFLSGLLPCAVAQAAPIEGAWVVPGHTRARLVAPEKIAAGVPFFLAVEVELQPEWHTYWINPGDSGIPTRVKPALPEGWQAGPLHFPLPHRFEMEGLLNFGYSDRVVFLLPVTPAAGAASGEVGLQLDMLVCRDVCVPEKAQLTLPLAVATEEADAARAAGDAFFAQAQARLPHPNASKAARFAEADGKLAFTLPEGVAGDDLFVLDQGITGLGKPTGHGPLILDKGTLPIPDHIDALVTSGEKDSPAIEQVRFYRDADAAAADTTATPSKKDRAGDAVKASSSSSSTPPAMKPATFSLLAALLSALLGGLILNAMPCVFPVLSLKALSIARQGQGEHRQLRAHGVAYTLGVLLCFGGLGAAMLALQSAGQAVGWGFQLQSPGFVAAMASLFLLMALNLFGLFEFPLFGGHLQPGAREGSGESFFTGLLAALVATPCTAPFMGSALGAAIGQPPSVAMSIFLALGFGMALPFLLLSLMPALARRLPRPGAWMQRLKEILALPLLAAAFWLLWVFAQQVGPIGLAWMLLAWWLVALGVWAWRMVQFQGAARRRLLCLCLLLAWGASVRMAAQDKITFHETKGEDTVAYVLPQAQPYRPERLQALRDAGRPVFIDATAAWCLTCKVNERGALSSDIVRRRFAERDIAVLVADWTREDPAVTALLAGFGRNGVPLYAYYPPHQPPRLLPQLLTPDNVVQTIDAAE